MFSKTLIQSAIFSLLVCRANTQVAPSSTVPASTTAQTTATAPITSITGCHMHGTTQYCMKGDEEVQVLATPTGNEALPDSYDDCHNHGSDMFCVGPDGSDVQVLGNDSVQDSGEDTHASEDAHASEDMGASEENCHFHAGVEHCVGGSGEESSARSCERRDRDYNVNLRIGLLFVILATSAIGVYTPLIMTKFLNVNLSGLVFTGIKQFGTGVIIATALVHLLTHAELMFANTCIGELKYEATATSIAMAGAFLAFLTDYIANRLGHWRHQQSEVTHEDVDAGSAATQDKGPHPPLPVMGCHTAHHTITPSSNDAISVLVLEAGIIFHSLLIGITLVVAGDSVFITLFIVIIFHQMFEGLALGARIAALETTAKSSLRKTKFFILPLAFALVTPIGMAIGIGVLRSFNGNDPSTIIALGTLDSLSAGILLWVGLVDMLARDWLFGELRLAGFMKATVGMISFVTGMVLMGLLGKWA